MMTHLLSVFAAARLIGISSRELEQLVDDDNIPHVRLPCGQIRFDPRDLEAWANTLKHPARHPETVHS